MKADTQIKVGRRTAIVLVFIFLVVPPFALLGIIDEGEPNSFNMGMIFLSFMYIIMLPRVVLLGLYSWFLRHSKLKASFVLFTIFVLGVIVKSIASPFFLPIGIILLGLLLQGLLGLWKTRPKAIEAIESGAS